MGSSEANFRAKIEAVVAQIPIGRVMTYGQLAAFCGNPRAARIVGGIAHFGDPDLPWHRIVNKKGGLAAGYPGGRSAHMQHLESEGVSMTDDFYIADLDQILWRPNVSEITQEKLS